MIPHGTWAFTLAPPTPPSYMHPLQRPNGWSAASVSKRQGQPALSRAIHSIVIFLNVEGQGEEPLAPLKVSEAPAASTVTSCVLQSVPSQFRSPTNAPLAIAPSWESVPG
ncbi:hypothetical protein D9756_008686 [Leucocoprinus leucothites]|uniref:Uncharacterized protein n=1 Tax=Leucocoprinus leucothites TaxID=201217 RepID=A0A8H5FUV8_9AGAR|nr:hypothetical protein D9756_008686 [Leucoagaricus leucothites]